MDPTSPPLWAELFGWYGAFAILGAYAATSLGWLDPKQPGPARTYQALNLTGALGVVVISAMYGNWQPVVLNGSWAVIALVALVKGPTRAPPQA